MFGWLDLNMDEVVKDLNQYNELLGVSNDEINSNIVGKRLLKTNIMCKNLKYKESMI